MLSSRVTGPVSHIPSGTTTWPPPFPQTWEIAAAKASVLRVIPSPTAPNSTMLALLFGMEGLWTLGMSKGRPS